MISRPLFVIHASLALLFPLLLALLISGCKPKEADLGPQASVEEIKVAMQTAFAEYDPNTMKVGEWAQLDETQAFNGQTHLLTDMAQKIVMREDDAVEATFRALETRRFFEDLKLKKTVDTEFKIVWQFGPAEANVSQKDASDLFGDPIYRINKDLSQMAISADESGITYHNLKTSVAMEAPPKAVADSPDCASVFPDCKIKVYTVSFDIVIREGGKIDKLQREYRLSPQVPYLGAVLSECLAGVVPLESSRIFVKECTSAMNFKFGTGSVTTP